MSKLFVIDCNNEREAECLIQSGLLLRVGTDRVIYRSLSDFADMVFSKYPQIDFNGQKFDRNNNFIKATRALLADKEVDNNYIVIVRWDVIEKTLTLNSLACLLNGRVTVFNCGTVQSSGEWSLIETEYEDRIARLYSDLPSDRKWVKGSFVNGINTRFVNIESTMNSKGNSITFIPLQCFYTLKEKPDRVVIEKSKLTYHKEIGRVSIKN